LKCLGDNIRGPRQESGDVSGASDTRDHVQVGKINGHLMTESL